MYPPPPSHRATEPPSHRATEDGITQTSQPSSIPLSTVCQDRGWMQVELLLLFYSQSHSYMRIERQFGTVGCITDCVLLFGLFTLEIMIRWCSNWGPWNIGKYQASNTDYTVPMPRMRHGIFHATWLQLAIFLAKLRGIRSKWQNSGSSLYVLVKLGNETKKYIKLHMA